MIRGEAVGTGCSIAKVPVPVTDMPRGKILKGGSVFGAKDIRSFKGGIDRIVQRDHPGEGVAAYPVGYEELHSFISKDSIKLFKVLLMAGIRAVKDPCPLIDPILIRIEKVDGVSLTTQVHLVQEVGRNSI